MPKQKVIPIGGPPASTAVAVGTASTAAESAAAAPASAATAGFGPIAPSLSEPIPFKCVASATEDGVAAALAALDGGNASDASGSTSEEAALTGLAGWDTTFTLYEAEWTFYVRSVPAATAEPRGIVMCLHGMGDERSGAFYARFWAPLAAAGFHILALDMAGHGRSTPTMMPARGERHQDYAIAVALAFGASESLPVSLLCDQGGVSVALRAYAARPELFGHHHMVLNPVLMEVPSGLEALMASRGDSISMFICDGFSADDGHPFSPAFSGTFLKWLEKVFERAPTLVQYCMLVPTGIKHTMLKPMLDPEYLVGTNVPCKGVCTARGKDVFYALRPSAECVADTVAFFSKPANAVVKEGGPIAPDKTAIELEMERGGGGGGGGDGNFRVFVRVRPMLKRETTRGSASCVKVSDITGFPRDPPPQRIKVVAPVVAVEGHAGSASTRGDYVFDRVFQEASTQAEVFEAAARPVVASVLDRGINATVFAYGQTGTGKTFTMEGPGGVNAAGADSHGVTRRAIDMLFEGIAAGTDAGKKRRVRIQYVQLYNTVWLDLLNPLGGAALAVEEAPNYMRVAGATTIDAPSASALLDAVATGAEYRASAKTNMNDASSRSHAILIVMVAEDGAADGAGSALYLVDLAGSERTKRSGVVAGTANFAEAVSVNQSLSALGRVVTSLVERNGQRAAHISYRDDPLTHLLKSSIGGASKTALVCCVTGASDSQSETLNTLRFALQASHVKNKVATKEAADASKKAAAEITGAGHELLLDEEGKGQVPLSGGTAEVRAIWPAAPAAGEGGDDSVPHVATIVCLHDFGKSAAQFDNILKELRDGGAAAPSDAGKPLRVIAPTWTWPKEKPYGETAKSYAVQVIELCDYLGIAKPLLYGLDYGALVACEVAMAHKSRVAGVVLQNRRNHVSEKAYKAAMKKDPGYVMSCVVTCWTWIVGGEDLSMKEGLGSGKNHRKMRGVWTELLWPCNAKGRPDPKQQQTVSKVGGWSAQSLKVKLVDSFGFKDADVAKRLVSAAMKRCGAGGGVAAPAAAAKPKGGAGGSG